MVVITLYVFKATSAEIAKPIKTEQGISEYPHLRFIDDEYNKVELHFDSYEDMQKVLKSALEQVEQILKELKENGDA